MAKKGNRVQVILECIEQKESGMPGMSRYITTKNKKNSRHKGDSGHFGIMSYLNDLEIIRTESECQSTNNGQPRIDSKCQHKKVKTDKA